MKKVFIILSLFTVVFLYSTKENLNYFNKIKIIKQMDTNFETSVDFEIEFDNNPKYWANKLFNINKGLDLIVFFEVDPKNPNKKLFVSIFGESSKIKFYMDRLNRFKKS